MKALTICQPFAELILLPATDPRHKRVENRTWPTHYRGMFYVHAGKSREWLDEENDAHPSRINYGIPISRMAFGAIVGTARLVDCVRLSETADGAGFVSPKVQAKYPWLLDHAHANGPWCWILDEVTAIGPWPWRGAQGLFDVDERELDRVANRTLELQQV
jgi:hypothetical protein